MRLNPLLMAFGFLALPVFGASQVKSNDWIQPGQAYFKVQVAEKGIYKITYEALNQEASADLSQVNPEHFQLFRMGEEQPITVQTGSDNVFDKGDFIEFYGEANDGTLDSGLYQDPEDQPHRYNSMYKKEGAYFLTWNTNQQGKRFTNYINTNYTQNPKQDYFIKDKVKAPAEGYNNGNPLNYNTNLLNLSYYTSGESWASTKINPWGSIDFSLQTPNHYNQGPDPKIEVLLIGDSRYDSAKVYQPKFHHETSIELNNNTIAKPLYKGYEQKKVSLSIQSNKLNSNNRFSFLSLGTRQRNLIGDYSKVSYIKISYPRNFNLNGKSTFHLSINKGRSPYHVSFKNYGKNAPILYDLTNNKKIYSNLNNQTLDVIIPGSKTEQELFLNDSSNIKSLTPKKVSFENWGNIIPTSSEFLIISNSKLNSSAKNYSDYRKKSGYNTNLVFVKDLYNSFSFGHHHSLAIRYFLKYLVSKNREPDYLLFLGKGLESSKIKNGDIVKLDLVPTLGQPPSDNLFVKNLVPSENLNLAFPVGRVPASNNKEVNAYLNKLKDYEKQLAKNQNKAGKPWRKNILHIGGGTDKQQNQRYKNYLSDYAKIAQGPQLGGETDLISKSKSIPSDQSQKEFVVDKVNKGLSLITYFGHGAAEVLEVDIGDPEDYEQNKGNYPIFLFSGCIIGNTYSENSSMAKRFIINKKKGGIAWLAESAFSFESYLNQFTSTFYKNMTRKNYGDNLGDIFIGTSEDFKIKGSDRNYLNEMQILQKTLQGDPAIPLYSPKKPDFLVKKSGISFNPKQPSTEIDSLKLGLIVKNAGKVINDSILIQVSQDFSDRSSETYEAIQVEAPKNRDTFDYYISPVNQKFSGNNTFQVTIRTRDSIQEITQENNSAEIEKFFPSELVTPLFPRRYSIVSEQGVTLKAQANNLFLGNKNYNFQIDTTPQFNSPVKKTSGDIKGDANAQWETSLLPKDSTVYYWRVTKDSEGTKKRWNRSSFMYIRNSPKGWGQGHFNQYMTSETNNMTLQPDQRQLTFDRTTAGRYDIKATGARKGANKSGAYHIRYEGPRLFYGGATNGIYILAVNPDNHNRLNYPSPYNLGPNKAPTDGTPPDTSSGVYQFNWVRGNSLDTAVIKDFIAHVDSIPKDYKVIVFTAKKHKINDLTESFYNSIETLGGKKIKDIENGWPYILMGEKGEEPGEAKELTADTSLPLDPAGQIIGGTMTIYPLLNQGNITSSLIGPSKNWKSASLQTYPLEEKSEDSSYFNIIGIDKDGDEKVLKENLSQGQHDLNSINGEHYPFLKINATFEDSSDATPPQLDNWIVLYDFVPEGSLKPDIAFEFHNDTLQQGENLRFKTAYQNISEYPMDSILWQNQILDHNQKKIYNLKTRKKPLSPGDSIFTDKVFATDSLSGKYTFKSTVNPNRDQPEAYFFNNSFTTNFYVRKDKINPALDVTFNGRHIKDKEIVTPKPKIRITAKDDNDYFLLNDTSYIEVYLTNPQGVERQLAYGKDLKFYPAKSSQENKATVIHQPKEKLANGTYQLRVKAEDESGNQSDVKSYQKRFRVVNQTKITNFYPYPNPLTKKMRFIFTITGEQVPDEMNVRIMTIRGKVIKELTKEDLGPLKMGLNRTNFIWQGRNKLGRPVENGVYLYRVQAYMDGEPIEFTETDGKDFAHQKVGKLHLMR